MTLPNKTRDIFDYLRQGHFLSANHPDVTHRDIFRQCQQYYDVLLEYFKPLGYYLESGQNYYHFTKDLSRQQIEKKLKSMLGFIDHISLMLQYNGSFDIGWEGTPTDMEVAVRADPLLKQALLRLYGKDGAPIRNQCKQVFDFFKSSGFMATIDDIDERYRVLDAYGYIREYTQAIQEVVPDETTTA
jgi:hypothetical protein